MSVARILLLLGAGSSLASAQGRDSLPMLVATAPRPFAVGEIEWERIREVVSTRAGEIAVADAGAARIHVLNASGQQRCSVGRRGRGPGEFQDLSKIWYVAGIIYAYDGVASRLTRLRVDCSLIDSRATPMVAGARAQVLAITDGGETLVATVSYSDAESSGLLSRRLHLATARSDGSIVPVGTVDAGYVYRVTQANATTTYDVPFLSTALVSPIPMGFAWIGRDSRTLELRTTRWTLRRSTALPLAHRGFDRETVRRHRDSVLATIVSAGESRFPGARSRIAYAFGDNFPAVHMASSVDDLRSYGNLVFVRNAEEQHDSREWVVVDAETGRTVGKFSVGKSLRVVGASAAGVYAVLLDEDEIEQLVEVQIRELAARR